MLYLISFLFSFLQYAHSIPIWLVVYAVIPDFVLRNSPATSDFQIAIVYWIHTPFVYSADCLVFFQLTEK